MAWFLVGFLRAFVIVEHRPREGKLLQDQLAGLIYLAALFAIVSYVFDLPIRGLRATSGVIAIILGLALQSSLADVFSGIVLSFSRPYRPGDWISIDGGTDGRVIELNWRATHVLTARRDLAIVPNSTIAKSKIVNVSSPSGLHGNTVTLQVGSGAPPSFAIEVIERALLNCRLILTEPGRKDLPVPRAHHDAAAIAGELVSEVLGIADTQNLRRGVVTEAPGRKGDRGEQRFQMARRQVNDAAG